MVRKASSEPSAAYLRISSRSSNIAITSKSRLVGKRDKNYDAINGNQPCHAEQALSLLFVEATNPRLEQPHGFFIRSHHRQRWHLPEAAVGQAVKHHRAFRMAGRNDARVRQFERVVLRAHVDDAHVF